MSLFVAPEKKLNADQLFINRELSWLEFNKRVLSQAGEQEIPLWERLKFLGIYFSNLDEFFMVRVGSLTDQFFFDPQKKDDKTGWTAKEQIKEIFTKVESFAPLAFSYFQQIKNLLVLRQVEFIDFAHLPRVEELLLSKRFHEEIFPLLSPLIIDHNHPFPFLGNKEQYIVSQFEPKEKEKNKGGGRQTIGIVGISHLPPYFVLQIEQSYKIAFTADVVKYFLPEIYGNRKICDQILLRATRNADITVKEGYLDYDMDFRDVMKDLLRKRKRLAVVRLQLDHFPQADLTAYLCQRLGVGEDRILVQENMPLDFSFAFSLMLTFHQFFQLL